MTAPAQTFDEDTGRVLVLRAHVSNTGPRLDSGDDVAWCAQVCDPASPLVGLYAFGDTVAGAREALAVAAWAAVSEGELTPCGIALTDLAGIRVEAASAATYEAAWLATAVAD